MYIKRYLSLIVMSAISSAAIAQTTTVEKILLNDIENGGPWPCVYYELNKNADLDQAVAANWFDANEDESYWQTGVGPFSNDQNKFFITDWASEQHPLLVRRHFALTAEEIAGMNDAIVTMRCSYDEDPVIYLNGNKVASYSGWNDNNYATTNFTRSKKAYFVEGDNILAVSLKQGAGGGHIDYGLTMKVKVDTGFDDLLMDKDIPHSVYTISGQKINGGKLPKGVYIIDGEKVAIE